MKRIKEENIQRDNDGNYIGVIYKFTNQTSGSQFGWAYIGATANESRRQSEFFSKRENYAGEKINLARKQYGPQNFRREVLFTFKEKDLKTYLEIMDSLEEKYIRENDSVVHGYNSNYGGVGKAAVMVKVIDSNGNEWLFKSMAAAGRYFNMYEGSVRYWLGVKKSSKDGLKFEYFS